MGEVSRRLRAHMDLVLIGAFLSALLLFATASVIVTPWNLQEMASAIAKREGVMPQDAHVYWDDGAQWTLLPPRLTVSGGWHTCERKMGFESGWYTVELISGMVIEHSSPEARAPRDSPEVVWTDLLGVAPDDLATFQCVIDGVAIPDGVDKSLPRLTVRTDAGQFTLTLPWDTAVVDSSGRTIRCSELVAALEERPGQPALVSAEDQGGNAWAVRIELVGSP